MMCGGTTETKPADDEAIQVLNQIHSDILTKSGHSGEGIYLGVYVL